MKRDLDVGGTVAEALQLYREQAGLLIPLAFWLFLASAIVGAATKDSPSLFWLGQLVGAVIGALFEGVVIVLVRDRRAGRSDQSTADLIRSVVPVWGPLIAAGIIYDVAAFVGVLLFVVPGLYLLTIWALAAPVIVVERSSVFDAFGRSRQLVRGNGWRVFGLLMLVAMVIIVLYLPLVLLVHGQILLTALSSLDLAILAPFGALVFAILYFRLLALHEEAAPVAPVAP